MNKKRILFVLPTLSAGGAERVVSHLLNNLNREVFQPELLLILKGNHTYLKNIKSDVVVHELNISENIKYFFLQTLIKIIQLKPNIVFVGLSGINVLLSPFIPFFKRKITWIARETNTISLHVKNKRMLFLHRHFYKNYDTIIAQSQDMKSDLTLNFNVPESKVKVINNPIDTDFIDSKLNEEVDVNLPKDKIKLLACGRLVRQKGFDLLIDAFAENPNKERCQLSIIGNSNSEEYTNILKYKIDKNKLGDLVKLEGFQENSYKWLSDADLFILSSRYEGFPNVVLESLYCGTPVIANDCKGGLREIIKEGENGYIFNFANNNFEEVLNKALNTKFSREHISDNAKSRFGLEKIMQQYNQVLNN